VPPQVRQPTLQPTHTISNADLIAPAPSAPRAREDRVVRRHGHGFGGWSPGQLGGRLDALIRLSLRQFGTSQIGSQVGAVQVGIDQGDAG
jgi:hypothetical protein